ncbi:MAG: hypothetical protein KC466_02360, partial [Myxococcales bacterium]|nr:hypothetical protein [Myxococcales bacterium]
LPVVGGLQCTQVSSSTACDDDETRHTVTAWEDGPSISTDGATLFYNYTVVDFAQVVTCFKICQEGCIGGGGDPGECADRCTVHCGDPIYGPIRDNNGGGNRIYGSSLVEVSTNPSVFEWRNVDPAIMDPLEDDAGSDRAPSVAYDENEGDFLAFSHSTTSSDPDLYLSEYDAMNDEWGTPATIDDDHDNAPYINTDCEEENPHLVRDDDGLRLYFESNRKWYFDGTGGPSPFSADGDPFAAANQPNVPWDDAENDCIESMRNLFVTYLEDGQSDWTEPVRVNVPDADHDDTTWADIRKAAPFVTPGDPTGGSPARGRQIYWLGRADDCYPAAGTMSDPGASNVTESEASLGCIYRAEQSGDQAIGAAWTNVTKIVTPTPVLEAVLGDVVVVHNPSLSGDRTRLYFSYIERGKFSADVEPPIDVADSLDDTDPLNPLPSGATPGLLLGDAPLWQNWRYGKGLAHPANFDAGSGDTTGWEDSINISADGRTLYFGYSPWILGQGLYAGPDWCADPQGTSCKVGRRVVPRILTNANVLRSTGQAGGHADAGVGVNIFEATIGDHDSNSATPNQWIVAFSEVNFEAYCGETGKPACVSEDEICINDILGEALTPGTAPCFTPADQGQNEGAVTVSTDAGGTDHMVFVRYGDITELVPSAPLTSPPETVSWRMYMSKRDCDSNGDPTDPKGQGTHWYTPALADFTIQDGAYSSGADERYCDDNDPHLTAQATSVYFDSRRHLIDESEPERCVYKELEDMRVYHSRLVSGSWSTPLEVIGGPNIEFLPWSHDDCDECGATPTPNCPLYCAPENNSFYTGRKAWRAHQVFVPEDESGMWFVGDGRDCIDRDLMEDPPEENPDPDADVEAIVTSCLYY